jgi:hypothetical protein
MCWYLCIYHHQTTIAVPPRLDNPSSRLIHASIAAIAQFMFGILGSDDAAMLNVSNSSKVEPPGVDEEKNKLSAHSLAQLPRLRAC